MAQSEPKGSDLESHNVSKSWQHLRWNNPDNINRFGSPTKKPRQNCSRHKCNRASNKSLNFVAKKMSKSYPKLSITTTSGQEIVNTDGLGPEASSVGHHCDVARLNKEHWWRCDGPCRDELPFFGMVRRSISRSPGPNDRWWAKHSSTCGGTFIKIKEPENRFKSKNTKNRDIRDFLSSTKSSGSSVNESSGETPSTSSEIESSYDLSNCLYIDDHVDDYLMKICDNVEKEDERVPCIACGQHILKEQCDAHFSKCMSDMFEVEINQGGDSAAKTVNSHFACPICLKLFEEIDLAKHVAVCSNTADSKTLFTFMSSDFND